MRDLILGSFAFLIAVGSASTASAQTAKATATGEVRYFNSLGDVMGDLPVDAFIKETRQGGKVVSATLDVCYSVSLSSDRKDRFVVNLVPEGQKLAGTTQTLEAKTPVAVNLVRKPVAKTFTFEGKITVGGNVSNVFSEENSDVDEKEFQQSQLLDDDIASAPANFTQVSPHALAVKVSRTAFVDLVRSLKDQRVQIALDSLATDCAALRSGQQVLRMTVDPERAPALIAKLKANSGVAAVGWTSGNYDMDRAIRFPATGWRDGDRLDRNKLAAAIATTAAKALGAKVAGSTWSDTTGELMLTLKRPSTVVPELNLIETLSIAALPGPDKPGITDRLVLWLGSPDITTADEATGPHLEFSTSSVNEEDATPIDDEGMIDALAAELQGQRWNSDTSSWK